MRNRWEQGADDGIDEPVTLTEGQLRSLKRGAKAGVFATLLALVAVSLAGWNTLGGLRGRVANPEAATATLQPGPAEGGTGHVASTSLEAPALRPSTRRVPRPLLRRPLRCRRPLRRPRPLPLPLKRASPRPLALEPRGPWPLSLKQPSRSQLRPKQKRQCPLARL